MTNFVDGFLYAQSNSNITVDKMANSVNYQSVFCCVLKHLFDICLRLLPVFSINRGVPNISFRNKGRGHIANITDGYKGGGRAKFSPKTALRNL